MNGGSDDGETKNQNNITEINAERFDLIKIQIKSFNFFFFLLIMMSKGVGIFPF